MLIFFFFIKHNSALSSQQYILAISDYLVFLLSKQVLTLYLPCSILYCMFSYFIIFNSVISIGKNHWKKCQLRE